MGRASRTRGHGPRYVTAGRSYCLSKLAKKGKWTVIATDVKDGVKFKLSFSTPVRAAGKVAA